MNILVYQTKQSNPRIRNKISDSSSQLLPTFQCDFLSCYFILRYLQFCHYQTSSKDVVWLHPND